MSCYCGRSKDYCSVCEYDYIPDELDELNEKIDDFFYRSSGEVDWDYFDFDLYEYLTNRDGD